MGSWDEVGECETEARRVFYTLDGGSGPVGVSQMTADERIQIHRVTKTLALLIGHLRDHNLMTETELDELMREATF